MIDFALYVFTSLTAAAGLMGHVPLTERLIRRIRWAYAWWAALRVAPAPTPARRARPVPSWAHTEPYDYDEAA